MERKSFRTTPAAGTKILNLQHQQHMAVNVVLANNNNNNNSNNMNKSCPVSPIIPYSANQQYTVMLSKTRLRAGATNLPHAATSQPQYNMHNKSAYHNIATNLIAKAKNKDACYAGTTCFVSNETTTTPATASLVEENTKAHIIRNKNEEAVHDLHTRIPEIKNIFDVHGRIGNGTFSTVLLGTLKKERAVSEQQRRKFAIKHHIPTSHPERIMKELQCMAKIGGSNNVVGINCCIRFNESVAFIMPYMQHDRFPDFYYKMDLLELQQYMKNLLIALRHVHQFNVIHRDVKPSNFLYNRRKRQYLLVDFGLAQQVPMPIMQQLNYDAKGLTISSNIGNDCKRAREAEGGNSACGTDNKINNEQLINEAKRPRCMGPQGDQAFNNDSSNGSNFKMPLKQINEINNTANAKLLTNTASMQKQTSASASSNLDNPATNLQASSSHKYNTNRQLNSTNAAKCYCYGNPQVCNTCLVKKEIHASRAGTPGYRPPEVLLKYADQTTAVDVWAAGVILLSILSSVYPFFKANNDFVALAEMVTIFGDKAIRRTAFVLDRLVTLSQRTKPLDLRKLCVRFRNRNKFSSAQMLRKYQRPDGTCEVCKNCDQYFFNCLCAESQYITEPLDNDDPFPASAYDLLSKLLEINPHERITAEEALKHAFFSEEPTKNSENQTSVENACNKT